MGNSELLIYQAANGAIRIDVRLEDETVWLTQEHMAVLFGKAKSTINEHIKNIFAEGELDEEVVIRKFRITTPHGAMPGKTQTGDVQHYNLDVVISVGYRVKSIQGTRFRMWATKLLREHIVKGFTLDDERFKAGRADRYFIELQERIREIRLSERFFYQKIKDIYATSIDYDPKDAKTIAFFKAVQNKLLWAISHQTAAELVYRRADAALPLMGMQSFDKQSSRAVRKSDAGIAKNYLNEEEIGLLRLLVEQYLAFAEAMAQQRVPMHMADWAERLDAIIQLNGRELLTHAGSISHQMAAEKAALEYGKFKDVMRRTQHEENMRELEADIKALQNAQQPPDAAT